MTDCTAKIRAKGLDSTGVTEDIASTLYANKGKRVMAIVELHAVERHEKADGTRRVDLVLEQVEPATDDTLAEHLRELTRTLYQNRAQADGQQAIDDTLIPDLKDAIAAGTQHRPHPFLRPGLTNLWVGVHREQGAARTAGRTLTWEGRPRTACFPALPGPLSQARRSCPHPEPPRRQLHPCHTPVTQRAEEPPEWPPSPSKSHPSPTTTTPRSPKTRPNTPPNKPSSAPCSSTPKPSP
jgi:hypothetical protein